MTSIRSLFSQIDPTKQIKLRTRKILDTENANNRAEFTLKVKTIHPKFKIYKEYNIDIDPTLAEQLIQHIAPAHTHNGIDFEYGVRKLRYNLA